MTNYCVTIITILSIIIIFIVIVVLSDFVKSVAVVRLALELNLGRCWMAGTVASIALVAVGMFG